MTEYQKDQLERNLKANSKNAFNSQAKTYDNDMRGSHARALYPIVANEVIRLIKNNSCPCLLDVGCGTGALAEMIIKEVPYASLSCIDFSENMLEIARARLSERVNVVLEDVEKLSFHDSMFDVAWCNDSFHHYPDPEKASFQLWRVLKSGGSLVIGDIWQPLPARAIMNAWMPYSSEGDVKIYSEKEFRQLLGIWFDEVSWQRVGSSSCLVIARKL